MISSFSMAYTISMAFTEENFSLFLIVKKVIVSRCLRQKYYLVRYYPVAEFDISFLDLNSFFKKHKLF